MRPTLLSVGTNHTLLGLRNAILARAGYAVVPVKTCARAIQAIGTRHLDAAIVGHSLSRT